MSTNSIRGDELIAEVLAIGDELASGQRVDTNSAWLSQRLGEIGIEVRYHSTASDDMDACSEMFRNALSRADIVIATGGLGPTADDLTRDAVAQATGCELQLDEESLSRIQHMFESRGREMPERNRIQAMFPKTSRVVSNPHGTAPGIDWSGSVDGHSSRVFCLPGVPVEMREMWEQTVLPCLIEAGADRQVIVHRQLKCFGVGESSLESRLPDLIRRGREPSVGITVHKATITLRITAKGANRDACLEQIRPTEEEIIKCLGSIVYGYEADELQDAVLRQLSSSDQSLATIELGTPGVLARWLSESTAGAPDSYAGGLVMASPESLMSFLNLSEVDGAGVYEDSEEQRLKSLVQAAAEAARDKFSATFGLAVGPIDLADATNPEARLQLALAGPEKVVAVATGFAGHPDIVMERSAKQALNLLRRTLLGEPEE